MKIKQYRTVTAFRGAELDAVVNELIKKGYQPYGNPYAGQREINENKYKPVLIQAMVLVETKPRGESPHSDLPPTRTRF